MVGKRATLFWESRAYKTEGARVGGRTESTQSDAETGLDTEDNAKNEEDILAITPARALDEGTAYREACARIDRLEGSEEPQVLGNGDTSTTANARAKRIEPEQAQSASDVVIEKVTQIEGIEEDPLGAEFTPPSKLLKSLNPTYRVANEQATHRRGSHRRPRR